MLQSSIILRDICTRVIAMNILHLFYLIGGCVAILPFGGIVPPVLEILEKITALENEEYSGECNPNQSAGMQTKIAIKELDFAYTDAISRQAAINSRAFIRGKSYLLDIVPVYSPSE